MVDSKWLQGAGVQLLRKRDEWFVNGESILIFHFSEDLESLLFPSLPDQGMAGSWFTVVSQLCFIFWPPSQRSLFWPPSAALCAESLHSALNIDECILIPVFITSTPSISSPVELPEIHAYTNEKAHVVLMGYSILPNESKLCTSPLQMCWDLEVRTRKGSQR